MWNVWRQIIIMGGYQSPVCAALDLKLSQPRQHGTKRTDAATSPPSSLPHHDSHDEVYHRLLRCFVLDDAHNALPNAGEIPSVSLPDGFARLDRCLADYHDC